MGYRSEVCLRVDKKEITEAKWGDIKELFSDYGRGATFTEGEYDHKEYYSLLIEDVKWYSMFKEVQGVEALMDSFSENDEEYGFIRVGEEGGDIEERGDIHGFGMYAEVTQTISFY